MLIRQCSLYPLQSLRVFMSLLQKERRNSCKNAHVHTSAQEHTATRGQILFDRRCWHCGRIRRRLGFYCRFPRRLVCWSISIVARGGSHRRPGGSDLRSKSWPCLRRWRWLGHWSGRWQGGTWVWSFRWRWGRFAGCRTGLRSAVILSHPYSGYASI